MSDEFEEFYVETPEIFASRKVVHEVQEEFDVDGEMAEKIADWAVRKMLRFRSVFVCSYCGAEFI